MHDKFNYIRCSTFSKKKDAVGQNRMNIIYIYMLMHDKSNYIRCRD